MNNESPVLVVSIHTNSSSNSKASGTLACYTVGKNTDEQSKQLALLLTESIANTLSVENLGTFPENSENVCGRGRKRLYIHDMNAPTALVETGFLSNPIEAELLKNRKSEYAQAIAWAIMNYLGIKMPAIQSAGPAQPSPPSIAVTIEAATIIPIELSGVMSIIGVWRGNVQITGEFPPRNQEMTFIIYQSCRSGNPCLTVLNEDGLLHINEPPSLDIPYDADNHLRGDFCFEYSLLVTGEHAPPFFTACFTLQSDGCLVYAASGALWGEEGVLYKVTATPNLAKAQIGVQEPLYLTYDPSKWDKEKFNWAGGSYEILINKRYGCIIRDNVPMGTPENWQKDVFNKQVGNLIYEINSWTNIVNGITYLIIYHYPPGNYKFYRRIELVNHQLNGQIVPIIRDINLCIPEAEEVLRLSEEEIVQLQTGVDTTKIIPIELNSWTQVIEGKCWTGSLAIDSPNAWRCISNNNQIFDPCFSNNLDKNYVICTGNPLIVSERTKLKLTDPLSKQERENRFYGWRFELEDNSICDYYLYPTGTLSEGEMKLMKLGVIYSCNDGSFLLGNPNTNTIWTVQKVQLNSTQTEITDSKIMSVLTVWR